MTNDPSPATPEWPDESPDFEVLGSLDALALDGGGDVDDGDYMACHWPPPPGGGGPCDWS